MQPCSSGLGMTLEASDFRSVRRLVAYSISRLSNKLELVPFQLRLLVQHGRERVSVQSSDA